MNKVRFRAFTAALIVLALVGAACAKSSNSNGGGGGTSSGGGTCTKPAATSGDLLSQIESAGVLKVSTDPKYPPQSKYVASTSTWEGFDVDVAREIAKGLCLTGGDQGVEWVTPSWTTITSGHWNGRWDISVGSMTITPERAQVLDFSSPYYYTPAGVAVFKTDTSITSPAALTGKKVGSCGGCTYEDYLKGTLQIPNYTVNFQVHGADIVTYDTDTTALADLALGDCVRLCAVFTAVPTIQGAIDGGAPIKILGQPVYYEPLAVAVDKESTLDPTSLVNAIKDIVDKAHTDGTLSSLSMKWYKTDLTTKPAGA